MRFIGKYFDCLKIRITYNCFCCYSQTASSPVYLQNGKAVGFHSSEGFAYTDAGVPAMVPCYEHLEYWVGRL